MPVLVKTLTIGVLENPEQQICAEILKVVIVERTGTTVALKSFKSRSKLNKALKKGKVDMYVAYTGPALKDYLKKSPYSENFFRSLKKDFSKKFNMIWLEPFGFVSTTTTLAELTKDGYEPKAAPLLRKETLKQFPALARLLNKLGGKLKDSELSSLLEKVGNQKQDLALVARNFLKAKKLI